MDGYIQTLPEGESPSNYNFIMSQLIYESLLIFLLNYKDYKVQMN